MQEVTLVDHMGSDLSVVNAARVDSHTQRETQEVAKMVNDIIAPLYPISWKELLDV